MPVLLVVRVFCDGEGRFGSPLGVIVDGPAIPPERRRPLAAELGFSETVFCRRPGHRPAADLHPGRRAALRGTPLVGTAWLLSRHPRPPDHTAESTFRTCADLDPR